MDNVHSKAGHSPIRTCVICKSKAEQDSLLNFYLLDGEVIFDIRKMVQTRKLYICHTETCLQKLDRWLLHRRKKAAATSGKKA